MDRLSLGACTVDIAAGSVTLRGRKVALTGKERALLRYLVARANRDVSREAILRDVWAAHPRSRTRAVDATVARLRRKIEQDAARPEHLATVAGTGYRLNLPWAVVPGPAWRPPAVSFGREALVADLLAALPAPPRWLTLTGIGGVGKSHVAALLAQRVGGRTAWRDLGAGVTGDLLEVFAGAPDLVVLDGADGARDAVRDLLAARPTARVVVTARAPLDHPHEQVARVPVLSAEAGAALYLHHATAVVDAGSLPELVDALDRHPLAIELAAARAEVLSVPQQLAALTERFALLASRTGRGLRAAVAATFADLPPGLVPVVQALAAVRCPLDATAVARIADRSTADVADTLRAALDRSLAVTAARAPDDGAPRATVLQCVRDLLVEDGIPDALQSRADAWAAERGATLATATCGPRVRDARRALTELAADLARLGASDADVTLRLTAEEALERVHPPLRLDVHRDILAAAETEATRFRAHLLVCRTLCVLHERDSAGHHARDAIRLANTPLDEGTARYHLATVLALHHPADAESEAARAVPLLSASSGDALVADRLANLYRTRAFITNDADPAAQFRNLDAAYAVAHAAGAEMAVALSLALRAELRAALDEYDHAVLDRERALATFMALEDARWVIVTGARSAAAFAAAGVHDRAATRIRELEPWAKRTARPTPLTDLAVARFQVAVGRRDLAAAEREARAVGACEGLETQVTSLSFLALVRLEVGDIGGAASLIDLAAQVMQRPSLAETWMPIHQLVVALEAGRPHTALAATCRALKPRRLTTSIRPSTVGALTAISAALADDVAQATIDLQALSASHEERRTHATLARACVDAILGRGRPTDSLPEPRTVDQRRIARLLRAALSGELAARHRGTCTTALQPTENLRRTR